MNTLKRVLALSLALVMVLSVAAFGAFTDEESIPEQNREAVALLSGLNILNGYEDGTFRPDGEVTRAEAAKMIYVLCNNGVDDGADIYKGQTGLNDVVAGSWYEGYVYYCYNVGVIAGRGNGTFDPDSFVTAYELMKMLLVVAEYNPTIQGYTGSAWQAAVLRDATSTGMVKGFTYSMTAAAPRHWAARLFYNTILNVNAAIYVGDALITNPALVGGDEGSNIVGAKRLGLRYKTGIATASKTMHIGKGADSYKTSTVEANKIYNINYDIPNEYLGLEVRFVYRLKNENLSDTTANIEVFSVYPTGSSTVIETTINDANFSKNTAGTKLSLKLEGFNNGKKKTFENGTEYTISGFEAMCYVNDMSALDVDDVVEYFTAPSGDTIRFVLDEDGDISYVFITETKYYTVNGVASAKHTFSRANDTLLSVDTDDIIEEAEYDRGDVVAITEVYDSGDCMYDIRLVDSTKVEATDWEIDGNTITSVVLDKETYELNTRAASGQLDADHGLYYIDKGTVVYSQPGDAGEVKVPSTLAMITGISENAQVYTDALKNEVGYSFVVKYLTVDGKSVSKTYDMKAANKADKTDRFGYGVTYKVGDAGAEAAVQAFINSLKADSCSYAGYDAPATPEVEGFESTYGVGYGLVKVNTTDDGVYFTPYTNYDETDVNGGVSYDLDKSLLKVGGKSSEVLSTSVIFAQYTKKGETSFSYKVLKGSDLKKFGTDNANYAQVVTNDSADVVVAYIDFDDNDLPTETTWKNFTILTGKARVTKIDGDEYVSAQAYFVDSEGKLVTKYIPLNEDSFGIFTASNVDDIVDEINADYENMFVEYEIDDDGFYELLLLERKENNKYVNNFAYGDITSVKSSTFVINGSRLTLEEGTLVFYKSDDDISLYSSPVTISVDGADAAVAVYDGEGVAYAIYINGDTNTKVDTAEDVGDFIA